MITKEVYFDLSGINDFRVCFTFERFVDVDTLVILILACQSSFNETIISIWDYC